MEILHAFIHPYLTGMEEYLTQSCALGNFTLQHVLDIVLECPFFFHSFFFFKKTSCIVFWMLIWMIVI